MTGCKIEEVNMTLVRTKQTIYGGKYFVSL